MLVFTKGGLVLVLIVFDGDLCYHFCICLLGRGKRGNVQDRKESGKNAHEE